MVLAVSCRALYTKSLNNFMPTIALMVLVTFSFVPLTVSWMKLLTICHRSRFEPISISHGAYPTPSSFSSFYLLAAFCHSVSATSTLLPLYFTAGSVAAVIITTSASPPPSQYIWLHLFPPRSPPPTLPLPLPLPPFPPLSLSPPWVPMPSLLPNSNLCRNPYSSLCHNLCRSHRTVSNGLLTV